MLNLPFAHLNLRRNPFGELEQQERGALAVVNLPVPCEAYVLQLIGAAGRGKSTHLHALQQRHPDAVYEYIPEGCCAFRTPPGSTRLLLLDEAQRLTRRQLHRLCRDFELLVLASHYDLTRQLTRPTQTLHLKGLDPGRLDVILRRRIEHVRRGPGPVPQLDARALQVLVERYDDDLRAIESHLYDVFQTLLEPCHVQV